MGVIQWRLNGSVSEHAVDLLVDGFEEMFRKHPNGFPIRFVDKPDHRDLARSGNADKAIQLSCCSRKLSSIDMEEGDRANDLTAAFC